MTTMRNIIGSVSRPRVSAKFTIEQYARELLGKPSPENDTKLDAIELGSSCKKDRSRSEKPKTAVVARMRDKLYRASLAKNMSCYDCKHLTVDISFSFGCKKRRYKNESQEMLHKDNLQNAWYRKKPKRCSDELR
jgi:hypothetical protein